MTDLKLLLFCGGSGTRLWPMSRRDRPKQFQPLMGDRSLFQGMIDLLQGRFGIENIFISTGDVYRDLVLEQAPNLPPENIIGEPEMRDTMAAVGYAVTVLDHRFPGATVATLWGADQVIRKPELLLKALTAAAALTESRGWVVKIDVPPTFPSPALGYIEIGPEIERVDALPVHAFIRQIEKPSAEKAAEFMAAGNFLWNTGYIVWTTAKILDLYAQHAPKVAAHLSTIGRALGTPEEQAVIASEFPQIEKMAVDYGLFQKMAGSEFAVMPVELGWSDIGAWDVLRDELQDGDANVVRGTHVEIDTTNSLIYGPPGKTIVTVGLDGFIVVDTEDALLICPANRAQDVKAIVDRLKLEAPHAV